MSTLHGMVLFLDIQFIFITHIASRAHKLWPEQYWRELISKLTQENYHVVLPWWSDEEKARSERLAKVSDKVSLIPPMNLTEKMSVLVQATGAISCDTGLAHMAASLDIPNIVLYGPTDPGLVGTAGFKQVHLTAKSPSCAPCLHSKCYRSSSDTEISPCMTTIKPDQVFHELCALLSLRCDYSSTSNT